MPRRYSLGAAGTGVCEEAWARHAFWSYVIVLRDSVRLDRDEFMQRLADDGIETRPVFYPMHVMPPYREPDARYPVADRLSSRGLSIPMHGLLGEDDVTYIAGRIAHWSKHPGP